MNGPVTPPRSGTRLRSDRCVAFVDLAGFTALTQAHGDDYAADVHDALLRALDRTCEQAAEVVCVKHLGDGALLMAPDAGAFVGALVSGVEEQADPELSLRVRAGVHVGSVLLVDTAHGQDVLGHTVNVAARLCGLAAPAEMLLSGAVARDCGRLSTEPRLLGPRLLRHITEPVDVWTLPLGLQNGLIDPVCHMTVGAGSLTVTVNGREHLFCSPECRETFSAQRGGTRSVTLDPRSEPEGAPAQEKDTDPDSVEGTT